MIELRILIEYRYFGLGGIPLSRFNQCHDGIHYPFIIFRLIDPSKTINPAGIFKIPATIIRYIYLVEEYLKIEICGCLGMV